MVVFGQSCCIRRMCFLSGKEVVFRLNWLYSVKSGCIRAKVFYSGKVVVFWQKKLYSCKVVVFRQSGCIWAKVAEIEQK